MIASRFRSVGLVSCVAVAAIACYMVSLRVAAERAQLTTLQARIVDAKEDIRSLQTEVGTRARLSQLERWNVDVLALASPKQAQYMSGEMQLASLVAPPPPPAPLRIETPAGPQVVQVALKTERHETDQAAPAQAAPAQAAPVTPLLRQANYIKPEPSERITATKASLLDDKLLGEIGRVAKRERAKSDTQ